ncbi:type III secretion system export apparatus subunit SctT [Sodalis sp. dw_96]|uniref:type III secretion system export apparatus subunit SctT n=1 Tax=Sodalis sp. dw_96 TaxID=2719794 RepID=UPI001BD5F860|nr:type III secretion system export apparatus subunit SctT [Sodalis sp. dw_96]
MLWGPVMHQAYFFILALSLGMARLFPCLLLTPIFSFTAVKGLLRTAIVIALALFPAPLIQRELAAQPPDFIPLAGLALKELLIGTLIGLLLSMPFWLYESVGALFDNQRGALMGGQLNPQLGLDVTPLGHLLQQTIILLLVLGPGLSTVTQVIWDSYELWPVTAWWPFPSEAGFKVYQHLLAELFFNMVLYAGPLVVLLLLMDFAVGILSLYSPQLQATTLAVPIKCLLGLLFFVVYLPILGYLANQRLYDLRDLIHILPTLVGKPG